MIEGFDYSRCIGGVPNEIREKNLTSTLHNRDEDNWRSRLAAAIPGGAHTYSKGSDQYPSNAPQILVRGQGAYVWDPDGRRYLDYGMGLRSVTLGYGYQPVAEAAFRESLNGNNLNKPSVVELEAAERLIDLIPSADMVKFAKNGSNVTTAAVKLARAYTGRDFVCVPRQQPFFSFDDWFIGSTVVNRGVPRSTVELTLQFDYGSIETLRALMASHGDQIACVIMEPATTSSPCEGRCESSLRADHKCLECPLQQANFLQEVEALCRETGALFILDEMITGFRWDLQGAQNMFGVSPDMTTFGKAMANGFSVAALVGRRDVMNLGSIDQSGAERTFLLSSTNGAEMSSLAAFLATVDTYENDNVCSRLWGYGAKLRAVIEAAIRSEGMDGYISLVGPDIGLGIITRDSDGCESLDFKTLLLQELVKGGVLMPGLVASTAHGDRELALTGDALSSAVRVYAKAIRGGVKTYLEGPSVKPVFRQYN